MQDQALGHDGFALITKVGAVLVAISAFAVFRLPEPPARLIVLALPAARESWLQTEGAQAGPSALRTLRDTGISGSVRSPHAGDDRDFWAGLFTDASDADGTAATTRHPVWEPFGTRVSVIAPPVRVLGALAPTRSVLAAGTDAAFVGTSSGMIAQASELASGRIPAPYDGAAQAVTASAETLAPGKWSPWIRLDSSDGQFQVGRISESEVWLSPVYKTYAFGTVPPTNVLLGRPFVRDTDSEARRILLHHLAEVERTRGLAAQRILSGAGDARAVVLFHTLADELAAMAGPEPPAGGNLELLRDELERLIVSLRDAAPGPATVLVVGGPGLTRGSSEEAWYLLSDGHGPGTRIDLEDSQLRLLVRYLLGSSLGGEQRRELPPAILARFPVRSSTPATSAVEPGTPDMPWNVETLQGLGSRGSGA